MKPTHSFSIIRALIIAAVFVVSLTTCTKKTETQVVIPTIETKIPVNITQNSASVGGYISDDGGATVIERGVCFSTTQNPTIAEQTVASGSGTGTFTCDLTGLNPNTLYYARAYGINTAGAGYGTQVSFTTLNSSTQIPAVTTASISNITQTTATGGGNVTSQGSTTVTSRGVCWSTSQNPTVSDNHTTDGSGTGSFTSSLAGLNQNTTYHVRAYATNSTGTGYGQDIPFTTSSGGQTGDPCPGIPTVSYGGKTYNTVQIGSQCWLKENLNIGTRINGSQDQTNNAIIEKYCYNDIEANCDIYGGLYQWNEMMQYVLTEGTQGICPSGWHLPSDAEWTILTTYLGGEATAGGPMKETGIAHWLNPNTGATNSSGFTALPNGYRHGSGSFDGYTSNGYFWSSTESSSTTALRRDLGYNTAAVHRDTYVKSDGVAARCVKN